VVNTQNQSGLPHELEAELYYQSERLNVWIPETAAIQPAVITALITAIEMRILPRIETIWGWPSDIDENGRFALLFAPTINEEKLAVGFFNPADFFEQNMDTTSPSYNPASNEMDILYTALPESGDGPSYSLESIIATIAHELTHAVTFTTKTWIRMQNGDSQAAREELFLDEGWSHLTENLCGFGVSGGNIRFLNRYLDDTALYSFCGANRNGQEDSAGMRGAITLFLSWLFWKSGGMEWDSLNPVALIDTGGITFLKRMVTSAETGWESIGNAFGKPTLALFNEMHSEINNYRMSDRVYQYQTDPLTNEAVDSFVNMGLVNGSQNMTEIYVGFPKIFDTFSTKVLAPWSLLFMEPFFVPSETIDEINAIKYSGDIFYALSQK
jgi:hypothetical protein